MAVRLLANGTIVVSLSLTLVLLSLSFQREVVTDALPARA
jgi:hypothetical protein